MGKTDFIIFKCPLLYTIISGLLKSQNKAENISRKVSSIINLRPIEEEAGQLNPLKSGYKGNGSQRGNILVSQIIAGRAEAITPFSSMGPQIHFQHLAIKERRLPFPLLFAGDALHRFRIIFPVPIAQGSGWDLEAPENSVEMEHNNTCNVVAGVVLQ